MVEALSSHSESHGGPGDIADQVMNLKVHLVERFLHVLKMNRGHLDQAVAMTLQGAEGCFSFGGCFS